MRTDHRYDCIHCGYDLTGLHKDKKCPECGSDQVDRPDSKDADGVLLGMINKNIAVKGLAPLPDFRYRAKYWMTLGAMFVLALGFLQLIVTFAQIPIWLYRFSLFCMSLAWPFVVIGMMPSCADASMPPIYRLIRKWIPPTQWCWAIGFVLWFVLHVPTEAGTMNGNLKAFFPTLMLHIVGGIGLIGLVFWLHDLALRLTLDLAARQCNIVMWTMATWGFIVFVSPWKEFTANGDAGVQTALYWFYVIVLIFPWLCVVILFARALFEFASDSTWSLKYDQDIEGRIDRVREKREQFDRDRGY